MNKNRISPQTVADLVKYASSGLAATMYTDRELFEKMNTQLPDELKICYRTFQRYKAAALHHGEMEVEQRGKFNSLYADLHEQIVLAGMRQKENLVNMMLDVEGNKWHRYKWLLEKKFPEFNQGCIMEKFRRENSYQDEDYPMFNPKKQCQQPVTVTQENEQLQQVLPVGEVTAPDASQEKNVIEPNLKPVAEPISILATALPTSPPQQPITSQHVPKPASKLMPDQRHQSKKPMRVMRTA